MSDGRQKYIERRKNRPPRLDSRAKWALKYLLRILIIILIICAYFFYIHWKDSKKDTIAAQPVSELMTVDLPAGIPSQLMNYEGFCLSFNKDHHVPNYVCWEITKAEAAGKGERISNFDIDPRVWGCATLEDYRRSGYDRGHMAPAGDMKWNVRAMKDCHLLPNIVPQNHGVNEGVWNTIEKKTREWVDIQDSLIVICGPILSDECPVKIGPSRVTVPERFFKIICAPHANPPMAIAFIVPNSMPTEQYEWYAVSIDEIEELTGFDFFASMPDDIENQMEKGRGLAAWKNHMRIIKREHRNLQQQ